MRRTLAFLLFTCIFAIAQTDHDYLTVRVLTPDGASPWPNMMIELQQEPDFGMKTMIRIKRKTDAHGVVRFHYDEVPPGKFHVASLKRGPIVCSIEKFTRDEIMHTGVVGDHNCVHSHVVPSIHARPGELIVFAEGEDY